MTDVAKTARRRRGAAPRRRREQRTPRAAHGGRRRRHHRWRRRRSSASCATSSRDHWSFFLGEIALYCFIILVVTGMLHDLLVPRVRGPGRVHGQLRAAARRADVGRLRQRSRDQLRHRGRPARAADPPLGRPRVRRAPCWCTCSACSSPAPIGARAASTGWWARLCCNWCCSTASSATRCRTTCCPAPACASPTPSPCPSRSSARGWPRCCSAASSPAARSSRASTRRISSSCRRGIAGLLGVHLGVLWLQRHTAVPGAGQGPSAPWSARRSSRPTRCAPPATSSSSRGGMAAMGAWVQINPAVALRALRTLGRHQPWRSRTGTPPGWRAACA